MVKSGKKGWTRIIEAVITALLVVAVLITISLTGKSEGGKQDMNYRFEEILREIAMNSTFRELIVDYDAGGQVPSSIDYFISESINRSDDRFRYQFKICPADPAADSCSLTLRPIGDDNEIYASERIISASLTTLSQKKIKIYAWIAPN